MFFGFQLTLGLMMVFYGYSVMKNPRVWGDQGRRAVKAEHFEEYCRQNGLFFLKAGCVVAVIGALVRSSRWMPCCTLCCTSSVWPSRSIRWSNGAAKMRASAGPGPMSRARKSASRNCGKNRKRRSGIPTKSKEQREKRLLYFTVQQPFFTTHQCFFEAFDKTAPSDTHR